MWAVAPPDGRHPRRAEVRLEVGVRDDGAVQPSGRQAAVIRRLSHYIAQLKGSPFAIDSRIGIGYLANIVLERIAMRARGVLRFPFSGPRPFIGRRVRIRAKSRLHLGQGVTLGHGSVVDAMSTSGVWLGRNTSIGKNTRIECTGSLRTIGKGLRTGENVGLGTDCLYGCAGGIDIGPDTIVGNFVTFHSENHLIADLDTPIRLQGVTHAGITVGADCWIGAKATVLDGARIGDQCVIAAGSVVIAGTYAAGGIYGGVPAKLLRVRG
jgi:acetyltransferase-like isoleucine patch superfamily enzyme